MQLELWDLFSNYQRNLMKFRGVYLGTSRIMVNRGRFNVAEFAMVYTRGGRRVPQWMKTFDTRELNARSGMPDLEISQIEDLFVDLRENIRYFALVPNTKANILAEYLAGTVCATAQSLSDFAGISLSTARSWLSKCSDRNLLCDFRSKHETFYLNANLIELALTGQVNTISFFKTEFQKSLELLFAKRNWLDESKLASFYH